MSLSYDTYFSRLELDLKGRISHKMEVGHDPLGNITRINHALEAMPKQLSEAQAELAGVERQLETAKAEVGKPFEKEEELKEKLDQLSALNALLNMDEKGDEAVIMDDDQEEGREQEPAKNPEQLKPEPETGEKPVPKASLKEKLEAMKEQAMGMESRNAGKERGIEITL